MGIGQVWEDLVTTADVVLPMVYPSHYNRGEYGFAHPNAEPYGIIKKALQDGIRRSQKLGAIPPRSARTCRRSRWVRPDMARNTSGPRFGPGRTLVSPAGSYGIPAASMSANRLPPIAMRYRLQWQVTGAARTVQTADLLRWRRDDAIRTIPEGAHAAPVPSSDRRLLREQ